MIRPTSFKSLEDGLDTAWAEEVETKAALIREHISDVAKSTKRRGVCKRSASAPEKQSSPEKRTSASDHSREQDAAQDGSVQWASTSELPAPAQGARPPSFQALEESLEQSWAQEIEEKAHLIRANSGELARAGRAKRGACKRSASAPEKSSAPEKAKHGGSNSEDFAKDSKARARVHRDRSMSPVHFGAVRKLLSGAGGESFDDLPRPASPGGTSASFVPAGSPSRHTTVDGTYQTCDGSWRGGFNFTEQADDRPSEDYDGFGTYEKVARAQRATAIPNLAQQLRSMTTHVQSFGATSRKVRAQRDECNAVIAVATRVFAELDSRVLHTMASSSMATLRRGIDAATTSCCSEPPSDADAAWRVSEPPNVLQAVCTLKLACRNPGVAHTCLQSGLADMVSDLGDITVGVPVFREELRALQQALMWAQVQTAEEKRISVGTETTAVRGPYVRFDKTMASQSTCTSARWAALFTSEASSIQGVAGRTPDLPGKLNLAGSTEIPGSTIDPSEAVPIEFPSFPESSRCLASFLEGGHEIHGPSHPAQQIMDSYAGARRDQQVNAGVLEVDVDSEAMFVPVNPHIVAESGDQDHKESRGSMFKLARRHGCRGCAVG